MSTRGVGFLLILTATIALGALAQDYRFDALIAAEQSTGRALDGQVRDLDYSLAVLQGAQQASVAKGQTPSDWLDRSAKLTADIEAALAHQRDATRDAETIAALDAAAAGLKSFKKTDAQIRSSLGQGDALHASDLIFLDGAGSIQKMHDAFVTLRARNRQLADHNIQQLARLRLGMNGVAVLFVLAVALYFGRAATVLGHKGETSTAQMLRDLPPAVKAGSATAVPGASTVQAAAAPSAASGAAAGSAPAHRPSNLTAAAELCVDLAKVMEAQDVPALLDRAASVLDARGIVFWAVDPDGARLRPSLSHGYPDKVLGKLRPLQIDADNVTSLAYRSLQPQMLNGASPADPAALAIPLMTGTGCVGVMAVELRHNRPHADLLSVARILGAQFSTLIAPAEETGHKTAHASS
jgi:hypothetical protein